jgi:hypothetical protein
LKKRNPYFAAALEVLVVLKQRGATNTKQRRRQRDNNLELRKREESLETGGVLGREWGRGEREDEREDEGNNDRWERVREGEATSLLIVQICSSRDLTFILTCLTQKSITPWYFPGFRFCIFSWSAVFIFSRICASCIAMCAFSC